MQQVEAAAAQKNSGDGKEMPAAYADDMRLTALEDKCLSAYGAVLAYVPAYGVFLCEHKTELVVLPQHFNVVRRMVLASSFPSIKVVTAARNLGSMLGPQDAQDEFAKAKAIEWAAQVEQLAKIAPKDPHSVYAVYNACQKAKWTYQQRVLKTEAPQEVYGPIEQAIQKHLLPALTGWKGEVTKAERDMLSLPAREGGMGLEDPTKTASHNYGASVRATAVMQRMVIEGTVMQPEDFFEHNRHMTRMAGAAKKARCKVLKEQADWLCEPHGALDLGCAQRWALCRARQYRTGAFLNVKPVEVMNMHLHDLPPVAGWTCCPCGTRSRWSTRRHSATATTARRRPTRCRTR